jgi:peptidoglycan/xylan/chitin deacetylase (PgdA/CDA1 family)
VKKVKEKGCAHMNLRKLVIFPTLCLLLSACSPSNNSPNHLDIQHKENSAPRTRNISAAPPNTNISVKNKLVNKYHGQASKEWGENVTGVFTSLNTKEKVIALTFDACGGVNGNAYDSELIDYLRQKNIPATLFINSRWIEANYQTFLTLSKFSLFEIENHGYLHRPLSVNGKSAWGIKGTDGVAAIVDEVDVNHRKIQNLTGKAPRYFRSGTAYYDDVAVKIVCELGERAVNYNVLGDAGATFSTVQVKQALLSAKAGSIALMHMNKPNSDTAEGVKAAIPELIKRGYRFVKLTEFPLK